MTKKDQEILRQQKQADQKNGTWVYSPPTGIWVRPAGDKGVGVFAKRSFKEGREIGNCPIFVVRDTSLYHLKRVYEPRGRSLGEYVFDWGKTSSGFPVGWAAFINHASEPNLEYEVQHWWHMIRFTATRNISVMEELTIDYGKLYWEGRTPPTE